jgi:tetratricopeptide (TPR) repeat protein
VIDLPSQLQAALGTAYRLEHELGGGGMSRVFLAEELALGRRVVVKVLPPEMGAGVNKERFEREIQLAARLQHPHVVPLLTAGSQGDLLWYVMPYVEGESLRGRLERAGELPVPETIRLLREVADALAYAHRMGVVHRDIKPDNVLLSEGHALVTDFGVAKAVSASSGASSLTSLGLALGTPAYMSPEQAAGDPLVDHRADLYAIGVLAYEMLSGRPPFDVPTPQGMLAAHVMQQPQALTAQRDTVPPALNDLVMRCLAKKAADRWQRAEDLRAQLDLLATPTAGITPAGTASHAVSSGTAAAVRRGHPVRVGLLFGLASIVTLAVVYGLIVGLGLPDWVFLGSLLLLAAGLPIMLVTGYAERQRALARTVGLSATTPTAGLPALFTWRRAVLGGVVAFAVLAVSVVGYSAMRAFGIGPVGTLLAAGKLGERDRLLIADFRNRTSDSTLGPTITELVRVDIGESPVVNLVAPTQVAEVLGRMQRPPGSPVDEATALEMAEREGYKAVIAGEIAPVGNGFVLSARLLAQDGAVLTAQQASARTEDDIVAAAEQLAAGLRERIGESFRTIRASQGLGQVTTSSLPALRLFTQALQAENAAEQSRAVDLLQQAIALDSGFAMAWRKLGTMLGNVGSQPALARLALTRAYENRDRLTERERAYAEGIYYSRVLGDPDRAIATYRTLLERYPNDGLALNNTGVMYTTKGDFARAAEFYRRAIEADSSTSLYYPNLAETQVLQGDTAAAFATVRQLAARFPDNPRVDQARTDVAVLAGDYARAQEWARAGLERVRGDVALELVVRGTLATVTAMRGGRAEATRLRRETMDLATRRGEVERYFDAALDQAGEEISLWGDQQRGLQLIRDALTRYPLRSLSPEDRPYGSLAFLYARAGDVTRARSLWAERDAAARADTSGQWKPDPLVVGYLAFHDGRPDEAITRYREAGDPISQLCAAGLLGQAFEAAGNLDSAVASYRRFVDSPARSIECDGWGMYAVALRRLGELHEQRGERVAAVEYYSRFADLWKDADADLQPIVTDVRRRVERLSREQAG